VNSFFDRTRTQTIIPILIIFLLCGSTSVAADSKPVLVVIERNPWVMVIGSDSPAFALYENGMVVYLRPDPTPDTPFASRRVSDANALKKELVPFDLRAVADHYTLTGATDQITTVIWTPTKTVRIYGNWRKPLEWGNSSDPEANAIGDREKQMWESLPAEVRAMLQRVDEERKLQGDSWLPEEIEVMFWPYEYATEDSVSWPKDWPDLNAKDTRKRGTDSFSVYLPSAKLTQLRELLESRRQRGAILIDGKKMAVSYRFPFPGEEAWMK